MAAISHACLFRVLLSIASLGCAAFMPACSSDAATEISTADVIREGDATALQLRTFVRTPADNWAWAGGKFDAPEPDETLPPSTPFEFSWHAEASTPLADADATPPPQMVFLLVFSTPTHHNVLRVFTTFTHYVPDEPAWQKLVLAAEPITLSLTTATFEGDSLAAEGGPHAGKTLTFSVE